MRATLVATLTAPPSAGELTALAGAADWLEVRADLVGDLDPATLARAVPRRAPLHPAQPGRGGRGGRRCGPARRAAGRGGGPATTSSISKGRATASPSCWRKSRPSGGWSPGTARPATRRPRRPQGAASRAGRDPRPPLQAGAGGRPARRRAGAAGPPALARPRDVIAFAGGPSGAWTRLLAPRLGAPWVYGSAGEGPAAPGQPSIAALRRDYGLPDLAPVGRLFGVVGKPVGHSLSPRLHNGGYRELGVAALYLAFEPESFGDFWLEVVESGLFDDLGMPLPGLSITAPFKRLGAGGGRRRQPAGRADRRRQHPDPPGRGLGGRGHRPGGGRSGRWPSGGSPSATGRRRWWAPAAPAARPPSRCRAPVRGSPWSTAARSGGGRPRRRSGSPSSRWPTSTPAASRSSSTPPPPGGGRARSRRSTRRASPRSGGHRPRLRRGADAAGRRGPGARRRHRRDRRPRGAALPGPRTVPDDDRAGAAGGGGAAAARGSGRRARERAGSRSGSRRDRRRLRRRRPAGPHGAAPSSSNPSTSTTSWAPPCSPPSAPCPSTT